MPMKAKPGRPRKAKAKPKRPVEPDHPVAAASWYASRNDKNFMIEVGVSVPWYAFKDRVGLETFDKLRKLALYDLYSDQNPYQVKVELGFDAVHEVAELRAHEAYEDIRGACELAMEDAAKDRTPEEWVQRGTDRSFRRMYQESVWSMDARKGSQAARDFIDRALPKVQRQQIQDDRRQIHLPEALIELLAETISRGRELTGEKEIKEIPEKSTE